MSCGRTNTFDFERRCVECIKPSQDQLASCLQTPQELQGSLVGDLSQSITLFAHKNNHLQLYLIMYFGAGVVNKPSFWALRGESLLHAFKSSVLIYIRHGDIMNYV